MNDPDAIKQFIKAKMAACQKEVDDNIKESLAIQRNRVWYLILKLVFFGTCLMVFVWNKEWLWSAGVAVLATLICIHDWMFATQRITNRRQWRAEFAALKRRWAKELEKAKQGEEWKDEP